MVDIVSSTALTESLGPERDFALIQEVLSGAVQTVETHGGHFIEYAGDSVFTLFGAPVAVENANGSWIDFAWSTLGDTGPLGRQVALAEGMLVTGRNPPPEQGPWAHLPVAPLTEENVRQMLATAHPDMGGTMGGTDDLARCPPPTRRSCGRPR